MTEKQWLVYILECADGTLYTGITDDLPKRLSVHGTDKGAKYTRGRGPFQVVYTRVCHDRRLALKLEYKIKQLNRGQKIALCAGNYRIEEN